MKKLITLLILFCSIAVSAQSNQSNILTFRGGRYYQNEKLLSLPELNNVVGPEAFKQYEKGYKLRKAGIICTSVGGGFILAASICFTAAASKYTSVGESFDFGLFMAPLCASIGGVTIVSGLICLCSGNHKLRNVAKTYNLNNGRQISLAPASNGVGLALRF